MTINYLTPTSNEDWIVIGCQQWCGFKIMIEKQVVPTTHIFNLKRKR